MLLLLMINRSDACLYLSRDLSLDNDLPLYSDPDLPLDSDLHVSLVDTDPSVPTT